jgi:hypothetical protein
MICEPLCVPRYRDILILGLLKSSDDGSVDEIGMAVEYVTQLERDRLARMVDDSVSYWITLEVRYTAIR